MREKMDAISFDFIRLCRCDSFRGFFRSICVSDDTSRFRSVRVPRTERRGIFPGRCAGLQVSPAGMNTVPRFALDSERSSDPPGIVGGDSRLLRVSSGADSSSSSCLSFTCTCFIRNVRIFPCPVRIRRARIPSRLSVSSGPCRGCPDGYSSNFGLSISA